MMPPAPTLSPEAKYRLLLKLSQEIGRTLDLQEVLGYLLESVRTAVAYDAAGVFVLNRSVQLGQDTGGLMIAGMAAVGFGDTPRDEDPMLRRGEGIIGHVIATGQTVIASDVRLDPHYVESRAGTLSGAANAAAGGAGEEGTTPAAGFLLANMEVSGGRIESHNRKLDTRWSVAGLTQTLRVESAEGGAALAISGASEVERFSYGSGSSWTIEGIPLTATEELLYRIPDDRLEFTGIDVALKGVPLKVTGSVAGLRRETMMMDLAVASPGLTVEKLLSLLPAAAMEGAGDVSATGNVSFTMTVKCPSNDVLDPGVNAAFRLSDGTVRYRTLTKSITGVAPDWQGKNRRD